MNSHNTHLEPGMVVLRWKDKEPLGFLDFLPLTLFKTDTAKLGVKHKMREAERPENEAQCDITIEGEIATLDYRAYSAPNLKNGALLGETRLTFATPERLVIENVEWRSVDEPEFKAAKFNLIFSLQDVSPKMIGPRVGTQQQHEIAKVLQAIREVCATCIVTKRIGEGWIFVPPSRFKFEDSQNKNLCTFWAGVAHHSIDIRRPRKGRIGNTRSEGKVPYAPARLSEFKQRMVELIKEMAPSDANDLSDATPSLGITITRSDFAAAFTYFEEAVEHHPESKGPFAGFRSGLAEHWEFYKVWLHGEAQRRLELKRWKEDWIGTGQILTRVIAAIEIKEDSERRNNIVEWEEKHGPDQVSHAKLRNARNQPETLKRAESLLYRHYITGGAPEVVFRELVDEFGRRYDLISYLFFLRDWHIFMPLRSSIFPKAFEQLGVPHEMAHQCTWENYEGFLARLREVRRHLESYNIPGGVRLLDAHSFCWMLAKLPPSQQQHQVTAPIRVFVPEAGAPPASRKSPGGSFTQSQLDDLLANQRRIGNAAQKVVLDSERKRLIALAKLDLAAAVKDVSHDTSLGYDIASYFDDGRPKLIEVKAAASRGDDLRFFLSENERYRSQLIDGYTFALVTGVGTPNPTIYEFSGRVLPPDSLHSVNYEVRLKSP